MLERDFFSFCTLLKPLELKALGELSRIRHIGESETVYSPGEPCDEFYIINRGVVEAALSNSHGGAATAYLSRGDIFGDVEVLTGLPRKYLMRTCEPVSLQCFSRANLPELARRVPRFFQYLAEHLASRLLLASDLALTQSHCLELSGSLSNFDLVTIYQTIVNSSQTGELTILNEESDAISAFFFEEGHPRCGQFQHLIGEEAFWQLFLTEIPGTFSFSTRERPISDWIQAGRIERKPDDMLINALQGRDEFDQLQERLPDAAALLHREKLNFAWPSSASADLRATAEQIWQLAYSRPVAIASLYLQCSVCELKVYQIVDELIRSHHFSLATPLRCENVA